MNILIAAFWFLAVLTPIIFIHELGHFMFARFFGVKVEVFSIGFGKSIVEWKDSRGTVWKIAMIPLGGYVKMFGDKNPASVVDEEKVSELTDLEREKTFFAKKLWQKALIVFAGPLANYILTILIFAGIYLHFGVVVNKTIIAKVESKSPAYHAGLASNDEIVDINGEAVQDLQRLIFVLSLIEDKDILVGVIRAGEYKKFHIEADFIEVKDNLGKVVSKPKIGVYFEPGSLQQVGVFQALQNSIEKTFSYTYMMLKALGGMFSSDKELDVVGPVGIAQMSKQFGEADGWFPILSFAAIISLNLGLINLFPIPMLDGGHLLFYLIEGIIGRPVEPKLQNLFFKIGLVIIILLMSTALWNDFKLIKNG
jgi:regulator of sigma E protease